MVSVIELWVPQAAEWLNSNQRPHWAKRAKITKTWRQAAGMVARASRADPFVGRVAVTVTFHKARGGRWDPANLYPVAKACLDGIVDSGLLVDDDARHVVGPDMRAGEPRPGAPCVVVVIREDTP